ncbi:putative negative regulator of exit from mitosis [Brettanomyces bruxellensis AWRI1499]|nr:putative negative regulator of exit from mitosis [Brettanomyces bruxellensis AWRI1499]
MSVLEIRGVRLNDFRAIVEFKKRQLKRNIAVLIETSEYLEARLRDTELQMDLEISNRIFSDIVDWLNEDEDEDDRNYELFKERRQQRLQHSD